MPRVILFVLALILPFGAFAVEQENCVAEADRDWVHNNFTITNNDPGLVFDLCAKNSYTALLQGLVFLREFPQKEWTVDQFDQNILPSDLFDFFKTRIARIEFTPAGGEFCPEGAMLGIHKDDYGAIRVCPRASDLDGFTAASALLHESRHSDGKGRYFHTNCHHGRFGGAHGNTSRSCDSHLGFKGAYAVGLEFYVKTYRTESFSPALRQRARSLAIIDLIEHFQNPPLGIGKGYLLQAESGEVSFFRPDLEELSPLGSAGNKLVRFFQEPMPSLVLASRYFVPTMYDKASGMVKDCFSPSVCEADAAGMVAQEFREQSRAKRAEFLDVAYSTPNMINYTCLLYANSMDCTRSDGQAKVSVDLSALRPEKFIHANGTGWIKNDVLFLLDQDGYAYKMPATFAALEAERAASLVKEEELLGFRSMAGVSSRREMVLSWTGDLLYYEVFEDRLVRVPQAAGLKFRTFLGPVYWSPALDEL